MSKVELQKNSRAHLIEALENLSSFDAQKRYKEIVPFVHVPDELIAQWDSYASLVRESRDWFLEILNDEQRKAMMKFDAAVNAYDHQSLADVPEIFDDEGWQELSKKAGKMLAILRGGVERHPEQIQFPTMPCPDYATSSPRRMASIL
ncbi:MAG: hypothetical protein AAFQ82_20725, partial [Myxococcota bacterium]